MRVGIVGAGITGLALKHFLARRGVDAVVLEAGKEPGGVIRTIETRGRVLELGPQRTRLSPAVVSLAEAVDLDAEIREAAAGPLYVYHDGRLRRVPRSLLGALTTDLLSVRGKLRALGEPVAAPPQSGETVGGFLKRSFGRQVAERIAGPLYAGLYASDPDEMPVEHSLSRAYRRLGVGNSVLVSAVRRRLAGRTPPPIGSFVDGLQSLPRALSARYEDDVHLDAPVKTIRRVHQEYELATAAGSFAVDRIVLTVPACAAAALLRHVDPASSRRLDRLTYNPIAVVHLLCDAGLRGSGYQIPSDASFATRGVTFNASLFGGEEGGIHEEAGSRGGRRDGLYTCFLGGATAPDLVGRSDDRLGELAAREFGEVTGNAGDPIHVHRVRPGMPAYDRTWENLEHVDPPAGIHLCANYESRAGIPGRIRRAAELATDLSDGIARSGGPGPARRPTGAGRWNEHIR